MEAEERLFADRSERGKVRFTGPQALWFLDQVLTQRFEDMAPGEAREAAMITVHGRMTAYLECLATSEGVVAHFEPELRTQLLDDLGRYVFATQVEIADVTEDFGLALVVGEAWEGAAAEAAPEAMTQPTRGLGVPAGYLWIDSERVGQTLDVLKNSGFRPADEDELEALRVANGAPRWGRDMDTKTFPQEAGIDSFAVHYDKGCYLGQEAMAKIHLRGKVNRRLARLRAEEDLERGAELLLDDKKVGAVTSSAGRDALAMVRYTVEPGAEVAAGPARAVVVN